MQPGLLHLSEEAHCNPSEKAHILKSFTHEQTDAHTPGDTQPQTLMAAPQQHTQKTLRCWKENCKIFEELENEMLEGSCKRRAGEESRI